MPALGRAARRAVFWSVCLFAPALSHAQLTLRPQSPLPIPTFTCADANPVVTTGALTHPGTALNTSALSLTDRGNQPRWAYAFDPANPGSHTVPAETAPATENTPTAYMVPSTPPVPGDLSSLNGMAWQYFSGREVFAYPETNPPRPPTAPNLDTSQSWLTVGFYLNNPNGAATANQHRFFRYQFYLAPEVDPAKYVLTLADVTADDAVVKVYLNGAAWTGGGYALGGGTDATQQWRTGLNTLTFAILDTNPGATRLGVRDATASNCAAGTQALALTLAVDTPAITTAQPAGFSGVASATPGGGSAQPLPVGTAIVLTVTGPNGFSETLNTTVTGSGGQYTASRPAGLAVGSYTVVAHLRDQPTVVSPPGSFTVSAPPADQPALTLSVGTPAITTAEPAGFSGVASVTPGSGGSAQPLPVGTAITLTITGPNGFSETLTTTVTGATGEYTATRPAGLAVGAYTVVARLSDQPAVVSPIGNFTVRAVVPVSVQPVPALSGWALGLLGALLGALGLRQRRGR